MQTIENKTKLPSHKLEIVTDGNSEEFWKYFEPIDLSTIFKKTKFLPGIKGTSEFDRWDTPGLSRTVYFDSGDTAQEEITACIKPNFFKYRVDNFSFALKYLCKYAIGEWKITDKNNKPHISWTYAFYPKNFFVGFILKIFVKVAWIKYMEGAMKNLTDEYIQYRNRKKFDL